MTKKGQKNFIATNSLSEPLKRAEFFLHLGRKTRAMRAAAHPSLPAHSLTAVSGSSQLLHDGHSGIVRVPASGSPGSTTMWIDNVPGRDTVFRVVSLNSIMR